MMIGPKTYIEQFEDKSYEELLVEKKNLINKISEFEDENYKILDIVVEPSPDVRYQCNLEYLAELCILIAEKYRKNKIESKQNEIKDNGTEQTHYFTKIYDTQEKAKKEILVEYNEKSSKELGTISENKFENTTPDINEQSLDDMIKKLSEQDPFWETAIKKYFDSLINKNDNEKINFLKKLVKNKDLFNEFTKEILNSDDSERLFNKYNIKSTVCPSCGTALTFLMPTGKKLYCDKCNKYYLNDNGNVGDETSSPYTRNDVLY